MNQDKRDRLLIKGEDGQIILTIQEVFGYPEKTCHWGGYETKSIISIKCSNYSVTGELYISTGEIYNFYQQLINCYETLKGEATLKSFEGNLELKMIFDGLGHAEIQGYFQEYLHVVTELKFEFQTDQSYLKPTIDELYEIHKKFGDNKGVVNVNKR